MPTVIITKEYMEKRFSKPQSLLQFLTTFEHDPDKELELFQLHKIFNKGLQLKGIHPGRSLKSLALYLKSEGGIQRFISKPLYLISSIYAMTLYNNIIQHDYVVEKFFNLDLPAARILYSSLFRHSIDQGVEAYRAICSLNDYPSAEAYAKQAAPEFNTLQIQEIKEYLRGCIKRKAVQLQEKKKSIAAKSKVRRILSSSSLVSSSSPSSIDMSPEKNRKRKEKHQESSSNTLRSSESSLTFLPPEKKRKVPATRSTSKAYMRCRAPQRREKIRIDMKLRLQRLSCYIVGGPADKTDIGKMESSSKTMFDSSSDEIFDVSELTAAVDISLDPEQRGRITTSPTRKATSSAKTTVSKNKKSTRSKQSGVKVEKMDNVSSCDRVETIGSDFARASSVTRGKKVNSTNGKRETNAESPSDILIELTSSKTPGNDENDNEITPIADVKANIRKRKKKRLNWKLGIVKKKNNKKKIPSPILEAESSMRNAASADLESSFQKTKVTPDEFIGAAPRKLESNAETPSDDSGPKSTEDTADGTTRERLTVHQEELINPVNSSSSVIDSNLTDTTDDKRPIEELVQNENIGEDTTIEARCKNFSQQQLIDYVWSSKKDRFICLYCTWSGKTIVQHYTLGHPGREMMISRLSTLESKMAVDEAHAGQYKRIRKTVKKKIRKLICRFCGLTTEGSSLTTVDAFYEHCTRHTGEYRFRCSGCTYKTVEFSSMKAHYYRRICRNKDYGNIQVAIQEDSLPDDDFVYGYMCPKCNFIQLKKSNVEKHVKLHHEDAIKAEILKIDMSSYNRIDATQTKTALKKKNNSMPVKASGNAIINVAGTVTYDSEKMDIVDESLKSERLKYEDDTDTVTSANERLINDALAENYQPLNDDMVKDEPVDTTEAIQKIPKDEIDTDTEDKSEKKLKDPLTNLDEENKDESSNVNESDNDDAPPEQPPSYESDSTEQSDFEVPADVNFLLDETFNINATSNAPMIMTTQHLAAKLQSQQPFSASVGSAITETNKDSFEQQTPDGIIHKMPNAIPVSSIQRFLGRRNAMLQDVTKEVDDVVDVKDTVRAVTTPLTPTSSRQPASSPKSPSPASASTASATLSSSPPKKFIHLRRLSGNKLSVPGPVETPVEITPIEVPRSSSIDGSTADFSNVIQTDTKEECPFLHIENIVSLAPGKDYNPNETMIDDIRKAQVARTSAKSPLSLLKTGNPNISKRPLTSTTKMLSDSMTQRLPFRYKEISSKSAKKCPICGYCTKRGTAARIINRSRTKHASKLVKFIEVPINPLVWVCQWCKEVCDTDAKKKSHHNLFHSHLEPSFKRQDNSSAPIPTTTTTTTTTTNSRIANEIIPGHGCPECPFKTTSRSLMEKHAEKHVDSVICKRCDNTFSDVSIAILHNTQAHPGEVWKIEGFKPNVERMLGRVNWQSDDTRERTAFETVGRSALDNSWKSCGVAKKSTTKSIIVHPKPTCRGSVGRKSTNPLPLYQPGITFATSDDCDQEPGISYYGKPIDPVNLTNISTYITLDGESPMKLNCKSVAQLIDLEPSVIVTDLKRNLKISANSKIL